MREEILTFGLYRRVRNTQGAMNVKTISSALLILALSSCCSYMPDDLMFEVKGVAPRDAKCELNLLVEGQVISTREPVVEKFNSVFYVSFCERSYTVQAICDGKVVLKKAVIFPNKQTQQPFDLGMLPRNPLKEH